MRTATLGAVLCSLALGFSTLTATNPDGNDKTIVHVLNRVAFGPGPGDLERVRAIGVTRYIDDQMHPERLADAGMDARLAGLQTLRMTSREIAEQFEIPQLRARRAKQQAAASDKTQLQSDPEEQRRANQV